jgi:hypothetical protein
MIDKTLFYEVLTLLFITDNAICSYFHLTSHSRFTINSEGANENRLLELIIIDPLSLMIWGK